jgi:hypothetical protein
MVRVHKTKVSSPWSHARQIRSHAIHDSYLLSPFGLVMRLPQTILRQDVLRQTAECHCLPSQLLALARCKLRIDLLVSGPLTLYSRLSQLPRVLSPIERSYIWKRGSLEVFCDTTLE